jgi:hypothetical protein
MTSATSSTAWGAARTTALTGRAIEETLSMPKFDVTETRWRDNPNGLTASPYEAVIDTVIAEDEIEARSVVAKRHGKHFRRIAAHPVN